MQSAPARRVAGFVRLLRREGYAVGIRETLDALRVIEVADPPDVTQLRAALRTLVCRDHDQWTRFRPLFDRYWLPGTAQDAEAEISAAAHIDPRLRRTQSAATTGFARAVFDEHGATDVPEGSAGRQKTLTRSDYRFLTDAGERRQIEQLAERLALRLRKRFVRRRRIATRGRRVHLRRTLRKALALGGMPLKRRFIVRRRVPPPLVVIQDISHSMAAYTPLFTRFVRGLLRVFRDAEAFAFHTELFRITELYRETDAAVLRARLEKMSQLWMGGTRIAESLAQFNREYAERMVNARTLVIVLSDGFDTDEPQRLMEELRALKAHGGCVIWLDPAASGDETGSPLAFAVDQHVAAGSYIDLSHAVDCMAVGARARGNSRKRIDEEGVKTGG